MMQTVEYINQTELSDFFAMEAFKNLRTNIQFSGSNIKAIVVTSNLMSEGKSTCSYHLAKSFAELGKRVLLLDADLRKSVLVSRFQTQDRIYGLTHFLTGLETLDKCICSTDQKNLHVMFAGAYPPNPAELLSTSGFEKLLLALKKHYDYIIIDAPPLGSVIDAAIIAPRCDGAILVIRPGRVKYRWAQNSKNQLVRANCKILGVVMNGVKKEGGNRYYGKYYGAYYSSEGTEKEA